MSNSFTALRCAIHVHSSFSDGELRLERIIEEAIAGGVDALLLTDHDHAYASEKGWGGYQDQLLLIVGAEYESREGDHFLAFGVHEQVNTIRHKAVDALRLLKQLGAQTYIAHPQGRPRLYFFQRKHLWHSWHLQEFNGIEAWSYMHDWIDKASPWRVRGMAATPHAHISGPDPSVIREWDTAAQSRHITALAGLDVHGDSHHGLLKLALGAASQGIFSYKTLFQSFCHYLLVPTPTGDARHDEQSLLNALAQARGWMCHDAIANGRDFRFNVRGDDLDLPVGSELPFHNGLCLEVTTPQVADISILNRGQTVAKAHAAQLSFPVVHPGEYRVEVDLQDKAWIRSNHIYLRETDAPDSILHA